MPTPKTIAASAIILCSAWFLVWRLRTGLPIDWNHPGVLALCVGAIAALMVGIWWFWWRFPQHQVQGLDPQISDPKARADVEDNFRKTVGQALGGAAVLIAAGVAYLQFTQQQQTAQKASEISQKTAEDLRISNQVAKGFEQLAGREMAMRLGGIYGLEGVMNTPGNQYHQPVLEALCAFVRDSTIGMIVREAGPATDVQAALTVIGRRRPGDGSVNLTAARIPNAYLFDANLSHANLSNANLSQARLASADLIGAFLIGTDLSDANLNNAKLSRATLIGADLSRAILAGADLSRAMLANAHLARANLERADLGRAILLNANLTGANLRDTNLGGANLRLADLSDARVSQSQLDAACGLDAKLPPGLTLQPCPPATRQTR